MHIFAGHLHTLYCQGVERVKRSIVDGRLHRPDNRLECFWGRYAPFICRKKRHTMCLYKYFMSVRLKNFLMS